MNTRTNRERVLTAATDAAPRLPIDVAGKITAYLLSARQAEAEGDTEDADAWTANAEDLLNDYA